MSGWFARESETAPYLDLRTVEQAYQACRRRKRATVRACLYEQSLLDHLVTTRDALKSQSWRPGPPVVFTVAKPKSREVYAAQFEDRVVHHWLVPQLEAVIDRDFIHDAASNRKGRGTHFAVDRLQTFMRRMGGTGWFLQLDIANFFNSIHQPTLLELLSLKLQKAVRRHRMPLEQARLCYRIAQRIISQPCAGHAIRISPPENYRRVPAHKRLENAPPDTGLPIGNLTSQFFANLYLNELDQFVKHRLQCRHYVRYVDDFVLLHQDRTQLEHWCSEIEVFLGQHLHLRLKPGSAPTPLGNGADFLGYLVKPGYRLVRRRVVGNLHEKLNRFERVLWHRRATYRVLDLQPSQREALRATLASYRGHFQHANSRHLQERVWRRFPWLPLLYVDAISLLPRWEPTAVTSLASQWRYFTRHYPEFMVLMQCGRQIVLSSPRLGAKPYTGLSRIKAWVVPIHALAPLRRQLERQGLAYLFCSEQGYLKGGMKRRMVRLIGGPWSDSLTIGEL